MPKYQLESKKIILASRSPRRQMLLKGLGVNFLCIPAEIEETVFPSEKPIAAVKRIAVQKAETVSKTLNEGIVIAADTIVVYKEKILGQPLDKYDAFKKLSILNGQDHDVITALCIIDVLSNEIEIEAETTRVFFRQMSEGEIWGYINTGEPMDKAGAYGIQGLGSIFVNRIEGCFYNVVGLPLNRLYLMLRKHGVDLLKGY